MATDEDMRLTHEAAKGSLASNVCDRPLWLPPNPEALRDLLAIEGGTCPLESAHLLFLPDHPRKASRRSADASIESPEAITAAKRLRPILSSNSWRPCSQRMLS
jgi:hypothetical protein